MKYSFLILFLSVSLSSAQSFDYPLHIGDEWEYSINGRQIRVTIIGDTLMKNGKRYMVRKGTESIYDKYQRQSDNKVFFYDFRSGNEYLLYDFSTDLPLPRKISSLSWCSSCDSGSAYLFGVRLDTSKIFFGVKRMYWYFTLDQYSKSRDDGESRTLTSGLGMIQNDGFFPPMRLTGAIINGIKYGSISKSFGK